MNIKIDALNYYGATKKYHLHFPALREDIEADVVIIGGGFSGINTALELAEQGITNVVVLEARHLGYGGTGRNGGQVMAGIGHDIEAVKKHVGKEGLETLFKIANLGAGIIRERIRKYNIDADFVPGYGYLAYNQRQLKTLRQWEKEFKAATPDEEIELYTGKEVQQVVGSEVYCGALKHMGAARSIHSICCSVRRRPPTRWGVKIFESSPVVEVNYGKQVRYAPRWAASKPPNCCGPATVSSTIWSRRSTTRRWSLTPTRCRPSRSPMN
ncbi:oxidoreductase [Klebsiella pneumoniae]|uniref:Oxidoreductase n=1 Tax=Klebsiella pneumoniae TaxID=573 RepID=A0A378F8R9_KLEPN|nr:oxidoreductase [Klebsiella pneumoniae]